MNKEHQPITFEEWYNVKTFADGDLEKLARGTAHEAWQAAKAQLEKSGGVYVREGATFTAPVLEK